MTTFYETIRLRYCNIAQGSIEESRYYPIPAEDLQCGDVDELSRLLEKVCKLLDAYFRAILPSAPCLPE